MTAAAALLLAALAALSAWLETRRPDRRRLTVRIGAAIISSVALALLVWPPTVQRMHRREVALLVTEGAGRKELAPLADSIRPARTLVLGNALPDLRALRARYPGIRRLVVAGWGLDSAALRHLDGIAVDFVPSAAPAGISELDWPRDVALGEDVIVSGRAAPAAMVRLRAGPTVTDSTTADSTGAFVLRVRARAPGGLRLVIEADGSRDSISSWVREARPPALLVLRASPSFEVSRLRDWLARRAGRVLIRTGISRGRARTERVNSDAIGSSELTVALLDSFDVLWIDASALRRLAPREAAILRAAVDSGLGVLLEPVALAAAGRLFGGSFPTFAPGRGRRSTPLRWQDGGTSAAIPVDEGRFGGALAVDTIAASERTTAAVVSFPIGAGTVVTSLVPRPSRWVLEGEPTAYDAYWSRILSAVGRPRARWELSGTSLPQPHHPIGFRRQSRDPVDALVRAPSGRIDTVHADPAAGGRVEGRYWPREPGMHVLLGAGDSLGFEVLQTGAWPSLRARERADATRRWIARQRTPAADAVLEAARSRLPRAWVFPFLLLGLSYLWWERRAT